jgi:hypothetical protein
VRADERSTREGRKGTDELVAAFDHYCSMRYHVRSVERRLNTSEATSSLFAVLSPMLDFFSITLQLIHQKVFIASFTSTS